MHTSSKRTLFLVATLAFALGLGISSRTSAQNVAPVYHRPVHLLIGVGAEGGGFVDRATGAMGGAQFHAGIHFYGVEIYGLTQGFIGSLTEGPHRGSAEGLMWNSAMFGFGAGPFHLAAGPSLDFAWGCSASNALDTDCYHGTPLYGVDARMALQFGHFEVSANVHPTFYGSSTVTGITVGLGWAE